MSKGHLDLTRPNRQGELMTHSASLSPFRCCITCNALSAEIRADFSGKGPRNHAFGVVVRGGCGVGESWRGQCGLGGAAVSGEREID